MYNNLGDLSIWLSPGTFSGDGNCNTQVGNVIDYYNISQLQIQPVPNSNNTVTIDCSGTNTPHFVFSNSDVLSVTINNLNLVNGQTSNNGGCISASGIAGMTVQNSAFQNCQATSGFGGAIYADIPISILDSNFSNNNAFNGGALYLTADSSVSKCSITSCSATNGGGLYVTSSSLSVTNTNVTFNQATLGGGLFLNPSQPSTVGSYNFAGTNVSNNLAVNGGGLYAANVNYTWNIYGATFMNNNATNGTNKGDPNVMCSVTAALFCYSCDASDCSSECAVANNNQSCSQFPSSSTVKCYSAHYTTCSVTDSCTCKASGLPKSAKILIILIAICLFVGVVLIVADVVRHFVRKNQSGYTPIK